MEKFKDLIPVCFGEEDLELGGHPLDEERAKDMAKTAKNEGISRRGVKKEVKKYLKEKGVLKKHRKEQLRKIKSLYNSV